MKARQRTNKEYSREKLRLQTKIGSLSSLANVLLLNDEKWLCNRTRRVVDRCGRRIHEIEAIVERRKTAVKRLAEFNFKKRASCDQCVAAMINGVFCHETGCPNKTKAT